MAGEWIKMSPGMSGRVKVTAMARFLCEQPAFLEWFFGDDRHVTRHEIVTHSVTFEIVTRVTVASLLDVWGAVNNVIKDDDRVPFMVLADIDRIARVPAFGEAMAYVDWIVVDGSQGLEFPNFAEFNTPESKRKPAKSQAQRAKEYRARKKAEEEGASQRHERHETSRRVEESREESSTTNSARDDAKNGEAPPPPTAANGQTLSHGEIRSVLDAHGVPFHLMTSQKGQDAISAWAEAGVTGGDIATAMGRAHQKNRDGPIGPAFLDRFIRQVVSERTTPRDQRDNHGTASTRDRKPTAAERAQADVELFQQQRQRNAG